MLICYWLVRRISLSKNVSWMMFLVTLGVIIYLMFDNKSGGDLTNFGIPPLYFSALFWYDWLFGALVAINLYAASFLELSWKIPERVSKSIAYFSSISFSLYLFHFPFLILAAAVIRYDKNNYLHLYIIISAILLSIGVLAHFTESMRNFFKVWISKLLYSNQKKFVIRIS